MTAIATLTPRELATERNVSLKTVYRWMRLAVNPLPHTRAGGRGTSIRIERDAMERWFRGGAE